MVIFYGYGIDIQNAQNDLELLCYYHTYHILVYQDNAL